MNSPDTEENNTNLILKPELAFEWIKYKKEKPETSLTSKLTQIHSAKSESLAEIPIIKARTNGDNNQSVIIESEQKENLNETSVKEGPDESLNLDIFKNDPEKERLFLWYRALFDNKEMTIEEFSGIIHIPDVIETEEFLYRHPQLKFNYTWRGKNIKFSEQTIKKLYQELKE